MSALCMGFVACDNNGGEPKDPKKECPDPELPDNPELHNDYYYADGQKHSLTPMETKYYMIFPIDKTDVVVEKLRAKGATIDVDIPEYQIQGFDTPAELADCCYLWEVETTSPLSVDDIPELVYLAPYYTALDGSELGTTNELEVRPEGDVKLEDMAEKYGFVVLGANRFDTSVFDVVCTKNTVGNAVEIANLLYEVGGYDYAAQNFIVHSYPI